MFYCIGPILILAVFVAWHFETPPRLYDPWPYIPGRKG